MSVVQAATGVASRRRPLPPELHQAFCGGVAANYEPEIASTAEAYVHALTQQPDAHVSILADKLVEGFAVHMPAYRPAVAAFMQAADIVAEKDIDLQALALSRKFIDGVDYPYETLVAMIHGDRQPPEAVAPAPVATPR